MHDNVLKNFLPVVGVRLKAALNLENIKVMLRSLNEWKTKDSIQILMAKRLKESSHCYAATGPDTVVAGDCDGIKF
jgi:hypothetical protein